MRKRESVDCGGSGRRATTSERPRITVLIATYNHGAFIGDAVESVLDQDRFRGGVQIVVVDDGSTDDTRDRLQPYESAIDYVYQPNAGQAAAWNLGLSRSHGEIIALLDADDTWHRHKLARVVEEFDKSPEVDVVSHAMTVMSNRGVALAQAPDFALRPDALEERRPLGPYLRGRPPILPPTSGIAVRSAVLARITPIPDQFRGGRRSPGADLYVAYLLPFYAREFTFIHEPLGLYRIHGHHSGRGEWSIRMPNISRYRPDCTCNCVATSNERGRRRGTIAGPSGGSSKPSPGRVRFSSMPGAETK
jgi:glycosyltransferase involved in cell wall biosynthesis